MAKSQKAQTGDENLQRLQLTEKQKQAGQFVKDNQQMAVADGFQHVSKVWYEKTISMESAMEKVAKLHEQCEDHKAALKDLRPFVNDEGKFRLEFKDSEYKLTDFSLSTAQQRMRERFSSDFASKLMNGAYRAEPDREDAELLVKVWNNALRYADANKMFLLRTRKDGTIRAMLSDEYGIINNEWVLETFRQRMPDARLSHFRLDNPDILVGNILIPDKIREVDGDDYGGMISIGNSEIGTRECSSQPGVFSAICMNGCIWGLEKGQATMAQMHKGRIDLKALGKRIIANLEAQIPLTTRVVDNLMLTRDLKLNGVSINPVLAQLKEDAGLTKKEMELVMLGYGREIVERSSNENSMFGVVNALTRGSQRFEVSRAMAADEYAGWLLKAPVENWAALQERAKKLTAADVKKALGIAIAL